MVCTANDLRGWKDFPKGLRVLLLDGDSSSAADISSKLQAMDYIVSTFCNENEALSAISSRSEDFHVAIVEVNTSNTQGSFKFLENAKDLPTVMTSNVHCLNTMMKCIALGAVEFLQKPLSEEKLRNIWQHVVHKAFNRESSVLSDSLKPVKESLVSMLQLQMESTGHESKISIDIENVSRASENDNEQSGGSDKYPAPSTPQLKQGARTPDGGDCQDHTNCSAEKESGEHDGESKSVETVNSIAVGTLSASRPEKLGKALIKEEEDFPDGSKTESTISTNPHNGDVPGNINVSTESPSKASVLGDSCGVQANRKKMKVDWTPDLHKKFVQAVEQLGVDQAIPSRILELMKVEGLTRHNVASHLQKYRIHKRHILPKEENRRLSHQRDSMQRNYYPQKPIMAFPPYHSNQTLSTAPVYPLWRQSGSQPTGVQMCCPPAYPLWQPADIWHWKPYPGMQADVWGCPVVLPPPPGPFSYPQNALGFHNTSAVDYSCSRQQNSLELHPAEEVIDKVVKEAISNPWLPLPLGLKPPSTDIVVAELSRKGISSIPPFSKAFNPH
ncbi:Two-component response regulator-like APRR2 [Quillaja saponaria]|uniref:Two-component response regulator-like APRR2 n=1 Tax=Quillaja saponaria TaxID=32244 RepID=A0AAD7P755_QUISA|nr:Two-component response regulator-like APRR2 [Quillaja saponaria]KAJ7944636.1 Two-component response regulator-like APRR2 [Quillaja saponaria]